MPELYVAHHTVWCRPDPLTTAAFAVRSCDTTWRAFRERAKLLRLDEPCWRCQVPFTRHRKGQPPPEDR